MQFPAITPFDGLVGGILDDGYIVTSPNAKKIFYPPLGGDRSVFLRSNLRFGDDDPLQWPQPFLPSYPHIVCIPRKPRDVYSQTSIMWADLDRSSFIADDGMLGGIGKISSGIFVQIQRPALELIDRAKNKSSSVPFIRKLTLMLGHFLHRLEYISSTYRTTQLTFRETQRLFLELTALLDWHENFRGLADGTSEKIDGFTYPPVTANVIGAFTTNPTICEGLFRAGVPVWLIRPSSDFPSIRVKTIAPVETPGDLLHPSIHPFRSIFRGRADAFEKYNAIMVHIETYLQYPNPFGDYRVAPNVAPPPLVQHTKRQRNVKRFTPC